jgi:glycosyltransferase involved in cell wall biosynthesis
MEVLKEKPKCRSATKEMKKKINVLMITGVYIPEYNGAVRQCRQLILELYHLVNFEILCGSNFSKESGEKIIDKILVTKVFMDRSRYVQYIFQCIHFYKILLNKLKFFDIVHIHGFSTRNAGVILLALLLRKKIIIKMTSLGQDDPEYVMKKSIFLWQIYKKCNLFIGISPAFSLSFRNSGLPFDKYKLIPNGVNSIKFKPLLPEQKNTLRVNLGYNTTDIIVLFVGHFSPEKNPILAYLSWINFIKINPHSKLIFIGSSSNHFEVDNAIIENIKKDSYKRNIIDAVSFIDKTDSVENFMQIADVFIMTSEREGLPNVLLEAMSCGLPCIAKNLPGITDWIIKDGETGLLFDGNDPEYISGKINSLLINVSLRKKISVGAAEFICDNFSSSKNSKSIFNLYQEAIYGKHTIVSSLEKA